jgi:hypothetical protein
VTDPAVILGVVYYHLSLSDLAAIQNRLGALLLSCVFLAFTSMSALPVRRLSLTLPIIISFMHLPCVILFSLIIIIG